MIFNWFDSKDAEEFGKLLAQMIIEKIPVSHDKPTGKALVKQQVMADKFYLQLDQFKSNHHLNVYKKAKLCSSFKFELISAGYEIEFIEQLTSALLQTL